MKPVSYTSYYWQNELVRLRALTPEDWENGFPNYFDSPARFLLQTERELPPTVSAVQEEYKRYANFNIACAEVTLPQLRCIISWDASRKATGDRCTILKGAISIRYCLV